MAEVAEIAYKDAFNEPFGHRIVHIAETVSIDSSLQGTMSHTGRLLHGAENRVATALQHMVCQT
eukprot:3991686-Amphidinium_carterae.3